MYFLEGLVGLSLSYALTITQSMSWLVSQVSEVETNMVGVERVREYQHVPIEAPLKVIPNTKRQFQRKMSSLPDAGE